MPSTKEDWERFAAKFGSVENDTASYLTPPPILGTGFADLDGHLAGGMRPGVYTLMAAPGVGKSALALSISLNVALRGKRVLYASVEMGRMQCLARTCADLSTRVGSLEPLVWSDFLSSGRETAQRMREALSGYRLEPGYGPDEEMRRAITDPILTADPAVKAMRALRELAGGLVIADGPEVCGADELAGICSEGRRAGLNLVVVDYLQYLKPPRDMEGADAVRRVSATSHAVTEMAKRLNIPVLVISSMGRESMKAGKPTMFGGKNSGDIEFDANAILVLEKTEMADENGPCLNLHVMKSRIGTNTDDKPVLLGFDGAHNRFNPWRYGEGE